MTLFGFDASHYQGTLTGDILARVRAEGYDFFTHKLAEGPQDTEGSHSSTALTAAKDAGLPLIGAYMVPRTTASVDAQVTYWLDLAGTRVPWWPTFSGWFWQIDLELWPYDKVPASVGVACAQEMRARTGRQVLLYASHGQYGDSLTGWDGPLWNANYPSTMTGAASAIYQHVGGDSGPGWGEYSGQAPAIWQFTSSAVIAGLSGCDANAFRGDPNQLRTLITGGTMGTDLSAFTTDHGSVEQTAYNANRILDGLARGENPIKNVAWGYGADGHWLMVDLPNVLAPDPAAPSGTAPAATVTLSDADRTSIVADLQTALGGAIARQQASLDALTTAVATLAAKVKAAGTDLGA